MIDLKATFNFFGDCDDENEVVNPGEAEVCDGIDNDCDLLVDDQDSFGCVLLDIYSRRR